MESGNKLELNQIFPKLILFGDSLTQHGFDTNAGWVSMVASQLVRKCDVINRGFSGYTSRYCDVMASRIFNKSSMEDVVVFVIFLGANDANRAGSPQHVSVGEYQERLVGIANYVKSLGVCSKKIILMSPPPVCDYKWIEHCQDKGFSSSRFEADTRQYALACQTAAEISNTEFVDLHESMTSQKNWEDFLSDGLHLSSQGAEQVFRSLWPPVNKLTKHLPVISPLYSDLDPENPEKSLFN